ncbi:MAG: radical SAM protein [Candidatus Omnitrophica bacterium]|nr:radical SAM protein [Candidatus Omnitrophota bacterium]
MSSIIRLMSKVAFHLSMNHYHKTLNPSLPRYIQIEHTVRCNLNCHICCRKHVISPSQKQDMTLSEIEKIMDFFPGISAVKLQGLGEPLMHPQLASILEKFKARSIKTLIVSNGTLLEDSQMRKLVLDNVFDIGVSLDGISKDSAEMMRPGIDWDSVTQGIAQLVSERRRNKSRLIIGINFVFTYKNMRDLERFAEFAIRMGVDYVCVKAVANWAAPADDWYAKAKEVVALTKDKRAEMDRLAMKLFFVLMSKGVGMLYKNDISRLGRCCWPFNSLFIMVNGDIAPCCIRRNSLGNVFSGMKFEEIWNSNAYCELRRVHLDADTTYEICGKCPD